MVHATTFLAYPKDYVFVLKPTCVLHVVIILSFQNLLHCFLILHEHVTYVTVTCDRVTLCHTLSSSSSTLQ